MKFVYLATPYSKYPDGLDAAFEMACKAAGILIRAGVPTFCPIAHSHPIAKLAEIDPFSHDIWLPADAPLMANASALVVYKAETWEQSFGIQEERKAFKAAGKPEYLVDEGRLGDGWLLDVLRTVVGK